MKQCCVVSAAQLGQGWRDVTYLCFRLTEGQWEMSRDDLGSQHLQKWETIGGGILPWARLAVQGNDDSVHCFARVVLCLKLCWAIPSASGRETTLVNKLQRMWENHPWGEVWDWMSPERLVPTKAAAEIYIFLFALWFGVNINLHNAAIEPPVCWPRAGIRVVGRKTWDPDKSRLWLYNNNLATLGIFSKFLISPGKMSVSWLAIMNSI